MKDSLFLQLPPELRLQIYSYILDIPTPYSALTQCKNPLIVINDTGNKYTTRGIYRALRISPKWVGIGDNNDSKNSAANRKALSLLAVNHQIHAEAEHFLYTSHTLFFLNGFDLDHLGEFLDTLSPTARYCIRSIGFEVYLFAHSPTLGGATTPKRSFKQYELAAKVVREKLPNLKSVLFYLDPLFSACLGDEVLGPWCDERRVLDRSVGFLLGVFGDRKGEGCPAVKMDFRPQSVRVPVPVPVPVPAMQAVTGNLVRVS